MAALFGGMANGCDIQFSFTVALWLLVDKLNWAIGLHDSATAVYSQIDHFAIVAHFADCLLYVPAYAGEGHLAAHHKRRAAEIDVGSSQRCIGQVAVAAGGNRKIGGRHGVERQLFAADGVVTGQTVGCCGKCHVCRVDDERAGVEPNFFVQGNDGSFRIADQAEVAAVGGGGQGQVFRWDVGHVVAVEGYGRFPLQVNGVWAILSGWLLLFEHGAGVGQRHSGWCSGNNSGGRWLNGGQMGGYLGHGCGLRGCVNFGVAVQQNKAQIEGDDDQAAADDEQPNEERLGHVFFIDHR